MKFLFLIMSILYLFSADLLAIENYDAGRAKETIEIPQEQLETNTSNL